MSASAHARCAHWQVRGLLLFGLQLRALGRVQALLQTHPDDPYALATCAHLLAERGDRSAARPVLLRLVALQPDRASGWFNLGYLSEAMGLLPDAELAFRRATELDPRLDRAWYGLGLCLIQQQRLDAAVDALRIATELQPMSPYAWYQLARVHEERNEPEQTTRIIRHLRGFEPRVAAQLVHETGLASA